MPTTDIGVQILLIMNGDDRNTNRKIRLLISHSLPESSRHKHPVRLGGAKRLGFTCWALRAHLQQKHGSAKHDTEELVLNRVRRGNAPPHFLKKSQAFGMAGS